MKFFLTLLLISACYADTAASANDLHLMCSPKLRKLLEEHESAAQSLSNAVAEAFSHRSLRLYYMYSTDEAAPPASHYYPDQGVVAILLVENQEPIDEFITLLYEVINSKGEKRFKELCDRAITGDISRTNFAYEVLRMEFKAAKETRDVLRSVSFNKSEISKSHQYTRLALCPDDYVEYLAYTEKLGFPKRDPIAEEELKYDSLRRYVQPPSAPK